MHSDTSFPVKETAAQATTSPAVAIPSDPSTSHYRQNLLVSAGERARPTTSKGSYALAQTIATVTGHVCVSLRLTLFFCSFADPPAWIPDEQALLCAACDAPFTFVRRKHHCRNCGKVIRNVDCGAVLVEIRTVKLVSEWKRTAIECVISHVPASIELFVTVCVFMQARDG